MKRVAAMTVAASAVLLVLVPAALAHDGGEGWYGPADDKVVTNAGFILIAFFPLFILVASLIQWRLDKRKERRKKTHKALAGDEQAWRGGW
jgi:ABC-type nickel/cobalt efflux system permease component RcnA